MLNADFISYLSQYKQTKFDLYNNRCLSNLAVT